jgi:tetratricopeptide (TPR) repeat protein
VDFLRALCGTKAKVLLTSRRGEHAWLGDLPVRVTMPPMPTLERLELAGAIAERYGKRLPDLPSLMPLLEFSLGNPMTISVTVRQVLRDGTTSPERLESYVASLRAGETDFDDEQSERRSRSLGASLGYGFEHAFTERDREILGVLHLFQGFICGLTLETMAQYKPAPKILRELDHARTTALLDRAAEIGLPTPSGTGYNIHPALPWYFRKMFVKYYPDQSEQRMHILKAFAESVGKVANYLNNKYSDGDQYMLGWLMAEEDNLLAAWRLGRSQGWWGPVMNVMQGLRNIYVETNRRVAWKRLVDVVTPIFVDSLIDDPIKGLEDYWSTMTSFRAEILMRERQWKAAEHLEGIHVDWCRKRVTMALEAGPGGENDESSQAIRELATALANLGAIQSRSGTTETAEILKESFDLFGRLKRAPQQALVAGNLGDLYTKAPKIRDFVKAEEWLRRGMNLLDQNDELGRGGYLNRLGDIAYARFREVSEREGATPVARQHLKDAYTCYQQASAILPSSATQELFRCYARLGDIYWIIKKPDSALTIYRAALGYGEKDKDRYLFGGIHTNMALVLQSTARYQDALTYAQAAREDYLACPDDMSNEVQLVDKLIAEIRAEMGSA